MAAGAAFLTGALAAGLAAALAAGLAAAYKQDVRSAKGSETMTRGAYLRCGLCCDLLCDRLSGGLGGGGGGGFWLSSGGLDWWGVLKIVLK